jgi:uncharacterized tellurite resistance protein B-like protein
MPIDEERILIVTDLLLGAAHADKRFEGKEADAVQAMLTQIIADPAVLKNVDERMKSFDPAGFDLAETAGRFNADPIVSKRNLLELVSAVTHADEELDLAEDDYLRELAAALGMAEQEYSDLALDYEVEALQEDLDVVINVSVPPPVPEK